MVDWVMLWLGWLLGGVAAWVVTGLAVWRSRKLFRERGGWAAALGLCAALGAFVAGAFCLWLGSMLLFLTSGRRLYYYRMSW